MSVPIVASRPISRSSTSRLRGPKSWPTMSSAEKLMPRKSVVSRWPSCQLIDEPRSRGGRDRRPSTGSSASGRRTRRRRRRGRPARAERRRSSRRWAARPAARRRSGRWPRARRAPTRGPAATRRLSSAMNRATSGTGVRANAVDVTKERDGSSNQTTASPPCPARPMALRGLSDSDTTRAPGFCERSSSARVVTSMRVALALEAAGRW